MSDVDILKEFLVKLGFKVDTNGAKKFGDFVASSEKSIAKLGSAVAAVGTALFTTTVELSKAFEKLYYTSQRTGSTVANIKSFDYAVSNLGGTADAAQTSLENLGHFIRSYPGSANFLEHLGVAPEHVKDSAAAMRDLQKTFRNMTFWQAQPYANVLGIDEKTLLAMQSGELNKQLDDYDRRVKDSGVDMDKAAENGKNFMQALRGVAAAADIAGAALENKLAPWTTRRLQESDDLLSDLVRDPKGVYNTFKGGVKDQISSTSQGAAFDFFKSRGWSDAQAAGIAAQIQRESAYSATAVGDGGKAYGLAQWHPDRQADFAKWSGHDIKGSTPYEQMMFMQYELTKGKEKTVGDALGRAKTAEEAGKLMTSYERPANLVSESTARGEIAKRIELNQTTNIHVTGSGDPNTTASAVASKQGDVNKQVIRNMAGAVQ